MPKILTPKLPVQKRKPSSKPSDRGASPLAAQQKAIAEQESKLRLQMEKYQRLIEEAPERARQQDERKQEESRARREELIVRASRAEQRGRAKIALPDRRFVTLKANAAVQKDRRLRSERNQGRAMFFVLLVVFGAVVAWLYFYVLHGGL